MTLQNIPIVSWQNGTIMIVVFGIVCILLVTIVVLMIFNGSKKN